MVNKKELKQYQIIWGTLTLTIIAALVISLTLGRTMWLNMNKSFKELSEKKAVLNKLEIKLENLQKLDEKKTELLEKNSKVLSALPKEKDISRLFVQTENIAQTNGLYVQNINENSMGQESNQQSFIKEVNYTFTGSATNYSSLKNTLKQLESALRVVSIKKINIAAVQNGLNVNFDIITFTRGGQE